MTGYALHPESVADLTEILEFIAEDNPAAADHVIEEIDQAIQHLLPFPHEGHWRKDLTAVPLKFWLVRDFLIAYAPDERSILVVAIHARSRRKKNVAGRRMNSWAGSNCRAWRRWRSNPSLPIAK